MKGSIVKKIFVSIVGIFILVMLIQLIFQNFLLEDIYANMKISKIEKSFNEFIEDYQNYNWSNKELNNLAIDYQNDNNAAILVTDKNQRVLNNSFFKDFNYFVAKDKLGNKINVIMDAFIDEEGHFRNLNNKINYGDYVEIKGMRIKGTNIIEPLEIINGSNVFVNDDGYGTWHELYNEDLEVVENISAEVVFLNLIIRDNGVQSYQQQKLWEEVQQYWGEIGASSKEIDETFEIGRYEFVEEYSGLLIVVLIDKIQNIDGDDIYVFSLFTLENIHEAFQILNEYYYYIFAFQLGLILILVYFYSRKITNPLIRLIDSAKSISDLDFTKRTHIKSNDELGALSNSLNDIAVNLATAIDDLENSNDELAIEAIKKTENEERMRNLLSSLSHEFKTPLGIISGFLEIIKDEVYEKEPEYYMNVIADEIEKLNGLVLETIDLSKLETKSYKLNLVEFELKPFILRIINKFENKFKDKQMLCEFQIDDEIVIGDKIKIEQVIINLLSNGIRYSPDGEKIQVTSKLTEEKIYIYVKNYGVTIEDSELDKIWDKFYRVEKSRNRNLGGSGLGLAIVKNILELHGSDYGVVKNIQSVEFYFSLKLK